MSIQLKSAKAQVEAAKLELQEYKEKATRILQVYFIFVNVNET